MTEFLSDDKHKPALQVLHIYLNTRELLFMPQLVEYKNKLNLPWSSYDNEFDYFLQVSQEKDFLLPALRAPAKGKFEDGTAILTATSMLGTLFRVPS